MLLERFTSSITITWSNLILKSIDSGIDLVEISRRFFIFLGSDSDSDDFAEEDGPVELHEREVTRLRSEKGSRSWIGIETGIETETGRVEARGGDEIMNTGFLAYELLKKGVDLPIVDPSLFSRELMAKASDLVGDEEVNYDPQILLKKAHAATSSVGSATVIVAMLERNGSLKIANVGDCGLRVIRKVRYQVK